MTYQEHPAATDLLTCVWSRTAEHSSTRVLPDACIDVIFNGTHLWVAGPDTRAQLTQASPNTLVGARFAPGTASRALGLPANLITNARVALADLWPTHQARELTEQLAGSPDIPTAQRLLATALHTAATDSAADPVVHAVRAMAGSPVTAVAEQVGLSERQLHRRCLTAFGYGPKTLYKVLRFQRALRMTGRGITLAEVAAAAGYSDQAHLARDARALAGVPLTALRQPR